MLQNFVSRKVSETVVYPFEIIEIDQDQTEPFSVSNLHVEMVFETTTVRKTCKWIQEGEALRINEARTIVLHFRAEPKKRLPAICDDTLDACRQCARAFQYGTADHGKIADTRNSAELFRQVPDFQRITLVALRHGSNRLRHDFDDSSQIALAR